MRGTIGLVWFEAFEHGVGGDGLWRVFECEWTYGGAEF